jgi:hypothetical protein
MQFLRIKESVVSPSFTSTMRSHRVMSCVSSVFSLMGTIEYKNLMVNGHRRQPHLAVR